MTTPKKMRIYFIIYLVLLLVVYKNGQSQPSQYIILSFEQTHKISQHGTKKYFWIISVDSIKDYDATPACLFLEGLSTGNIADCCAGREIDPFLVLPGTTYIHDSLNAKLASKLTNIISKNRKRIQTITKDWNAGQKETIKVFATPVTGIFCFSKLHAIGQDRTGFHGLVSVISSSSNSYPEFWSSPKAKFILNRDFLEVPFDIIPWPK